MAVLIYTEHSDRIFHQFSQIFRNEKKAALAISAESKWVPRFTYFHLGQSPNLPSFVAQFPSDRI